MLLNTTSAFSAEPACEKFRPIRDLFNYSIFIERKTKFKRHFSSCRKSFSSNVFGGIVRSIRPIVVFPACGRGEDFSVGVTYPFLDFFVLGLSMKRFVQLKSTFKAVRQRMIECDPEQPPPACQVDAKNRVIV